MAHLRASSEPNGNPFWSERARGEFQLQISRPRDLDVMSSGPTRDLLPPVPPEREGEWSEGSVSRDPLQDESREGRGRTIDQDMLMEQGKEETLVRQKGVFGHLQAVGTCRIGASCPKRRR